MNRLPLLFAFLVAFLVAFPVTAQDGHLDPNFGAKGTVLVSGPRIDFAPEATSIDDRDRIYAWGQTDLPTVPRIVRILPDGSLDEPVIQSDEYYFNTRAQQIVSALPDRDGFLTVGNKRPGGRTDYDTGFIARVRGDGVTGRASGAFYRGIRGRDESAEVLAFARSPRGPYLVAVRSYNAADGMATCAVQMTNRTGPLVPTYGTDGSATVVRGLECSITGIEAANDGSVIASYDVRHDPDNPRVFSRVRRLTPAGRTDAGYFQRASQPLVANGNPSASVRAVDNKQRAILLMMPNVEPVPRLIRLAPNGAPIPWADGSDALRLPVPGPLLGPYTVTVDGRDRIYVGYAAEEATATGLRARAIVVRFTESGELDTSFGNEGIAKVSPPEGPLSRETIHGLDFDSEGDLRVLWTERRGSSRLALYLSKLLVGTSDALAAPSASATVPAGLEVMPNPVRDDLRIRLTLDEAQSATLVVIDALGREVRREALSASTEHRRTVSLGGLPSGVYSVVVRTDAEVYHQRVTVVR